MNLRIPIEWLAAASLCLGLWTSSAAEEPAAWRVGPTAWTFHTVTFYEAIEKTASLNLKYLEAFQGQRVSKDSDRKLDENLSDEALAQIREKFKASHVKLTSIYMRSIPGDEAGCRRAFEFARKLGVEFIVSEPAPDALATIDKFCGEYRINVALHNHPQGKSRYWDPREVLKACEGRSPRIGACGDTGHWLRSGIKPDEAVRRLGSRLLTLHLKDLDAAMHDVPWGTGKADVAQLFRTLRELKVNPALFGIEYESHFENNLAEVAQCAKFFEQETQRVPGPAAK